MSRPLLTRLSLSVAVLVAPVLLLMVTGVFTGSLDMGGREMLVWLALVAAGLWLVWRR